MQDAHLKLSSVLSDVYGVSGRAMLDALIAGARDPRALAQLARGPARRKIRQLEEALDCAFLTPGHVWVLSAMLRRTGGLTANIAAVTARIGLVSPTTGRQDRPAVHHPRILRGHRRDLIAEIGTGMSAGMSCAGAMPRAIAGCRYGGIDTQPGFPASSLCTASVPSGRRATTHVGERAAPVDQNSQRPRPSPSFLRKKMLRRAAVQAAAGDIDAAEPRRGNVPEYVLDHHQEGERQRLALMSRLLDPMHRRHIERLSVSTGARTLEVGCGNGSMSAWLAGQVAPGGRAVAVDLDLSLVNVDVPGLELHQADILAGPGGAGEVLDLVTARAMLHHVADAEAAVANLLASARPGGAIVLIEPDFLPVSAAEPPQIREFWQGWLAWSRGEGIDYFIGRRLPAMLSRRGLYDIQATAETALANGGSLWAEYWRQTVIELRPRLDGLRQTQRPVHRHLSGPVRRPGVVDLDRSPSLLSPGAHHPRPSNPSWLTITASRSAHFADLRIHC